MSRASATAEKRSIVLIGRENGLSIIPQPTPLTRLRYFDGKFLRAADLELEQRYHRELVAQSNRAGGSGVVHGFDCTLAGDALTVGAGLAIDPGGRVLLLPEERQLSLDELLAASRSRAAISPARRIAGGRLVAGAFDDCEQVTADDGGAVAEGTSLHLIVAFHAEALCGEEDVYGKLCEEACVTSTERPYVVEGVVVRAVPLDLATPLATSTAVTLTRKHLRSRVASAFYADERQAVASLISRAGLATEVWCRGALAAAGSGVPLGLVARAGSDTLFLDAWIARRERIEPPPRRYWARVMAMRPWDVFLAQVLQFQCQLRSALAGAADPGGADDPCADAHRLLADASAGIERVLLGVVDKQVEPERGDERAELAFFARRAEDAAERPVAGGSGRSGREVVGGSPAGLAELIGEAAGGGGRNPGLLALDAIRSRLSSAAEAFFTPATERLLLAGGIVELPSAGYLPVLPSSTVGVERQVRQLVGEGLDLRFCAVRPDFVPHALEEAQHMERISLTAGLDDPEAKPRVDVLVPDGTFEEAPTVSPGTGYETRVNVQQVALSLFTALFGGNPLPIAAVTGSATTAFRRALPPPLGAFGAARGEALPGGGSAFHFAGRTPGAGKPKPSFEARPVGGFSGGELGPIRRRSDAAAEFDAHLAGLSPAARLRAVDPTAAATAGFSVFEGRESPASLWATLRTDLDPFALPLHGSSQVSAEIVLLHPSQPPRLLRRLRFAGTLTVTARRSLGGGGVGLDTRLFGVGTVTETQLDAPASATASVPVDELVRLERDGGERPAVRIVAPAVGLWPRSDNRFDFNVERRWPAADRSEVESDLTIAKIEPKSAVFDADERIDAAVLKPGNAAHSASLAALEAIGAALGDLDFAARAARTLFPPPDATQPTATLRATRDWVLFHRRRDKDCGEREAPAERVEPRRYRLFHLGLRDAAEVETLGAVLAAGRSLPGFAPRLVAAVDFGPGIQAVETPHDEVRTAWSARVPGEAEIVYAAIASRGAALGEGEPLAGSRLEALAAVLAPEAGRTADARTEVLPTVPAALSAGAGDGVILIATTSVALECNEVWRAALPAGSFEDLAGLAQELPLSTLLKRLQAQRLGRAGFRGGTAEPFGPGMADVPDEWRRAGDGAVAEAVALTAAGTDEQQAGVAAEQATAIVAAVGGGVDADGNVPPVRSLRTVDTTLGQCPALTLLVARPEVARTCHEVVVVPTSTGDNRDAMVGVIAQRGLRAEQLAGRGFTALGAVEFSEGSPAPLADSLGRAVGVWRSNLGGTALPAGFQVVGIAVSPAGSSAELQELHRRQAGQVLAALGGDPQVVGVLNGGDGPFPVDCEGLLLVVPIRTGNRGILPVIFNPRGGQPRVVLAPRFDDAGEVIRDEAFRREVAALGEEGTRFVRLAFAAGERPESSDRRLVSLFEALEEAGVVSDDARRSTRTLKRKDREELEERVGAAMPAVLMLEDE